MAEALENTIPCDRCNTPIDLQDWSRHVRNCSGNQNNQTKREKRRTSDDESENDRISCEYCNVFISVNNLKSHTRTCADKYTRRVDDSKTDFHNEPLDETIPCEYCDTQISIHDWELHTKRCADSHRRGNKNPPSQREVLVLIPCEHCNTQIIADEWDRHTRQCANSYGRDISRSENDESTLIPCEYCNALVAAQEWARHTNKCAEAEKKRISDKAKRIATESSDVLIPCEYCNESFSMQKIEKHQKKCRTKQTGSTFRPDTPNGEASGANFTWSENGNGSPTKNLTRYIVDPGTPEYNFVADNFHKTLQANQIVQIERIQNRRWYRQYEAHKDDFIERYGNSTEQWLFHGCRKGESAEAIIADCFNRSHAVNCAVGQGIYFATNASTSLGYTQPDAQGLRHMFMARVLVGRTTRGDRSTRVCPTGYDTTGGKGVFVTYHDAQAYAQYLITFR